MSKPQIKVFVGVDMAKEEHYAQAITTDGEELFSRPVQNDQAAIEKMLDAAVVHGPVAVIINMTSSGAQLMLGVMAQREMPVAYVSGLVMRRAADLYAGAAKTDPRDAWVLADYARRNPDRLQWIEIGDELLVHLRVLNGHDTDLASDANRTINRCRDALLAVSPALERILGHRLTQPGIRDLLTKWPTPTTLHTAGRTKIRNAIGRRSPRLATTLTTHILTAIGTQTVTLPAETTWGEVITNLIGDLERIQTRRGELTAKIEEAFLDHPLGQVLNTLPGFGPRTGARTLAEIGDPYRFKNGSRLAAYAGLAPVNHRSGKKHQPHHPTPRRQPPPQKRHVPLNIRSFTTRPHRQGLLPTQTIRRKTPQRRRHLRRPPPLRPHPRHAQKPNPLQPPTHTPTRFGKQIETPPACYTPPHPHVPLRGQPTARRQPRAFPGPAPRQAAATPPTPPGAYPEAAA